MIDLLNSLFVLLALATSIADLRQILSDKEVKGLHIATAALFTCWPLWDLVYYSSLRQWFSLCACAMLVVSRAIWLCLLFFYRTDPGQES